MATARAPAAAADSPIARRPRRSASASSPASRTGGVDDSTWCRKSSRATSSSDSLAAAARSARDVARRVVGSMRTNSSSTPNDRRSSVVMAHSEAGGLPVLAPLLAQGVADLPQGRFGTARVQHRRDHVGVLAGGGEHRLDRPRDLGLVATRLALVEESHLLGLDLVRDAEDLQLA